MEAEQRANILAEGLSREEWEDIQWALIRMIQDYSRYPLSAPTEKVNQLRELAVKVGAFMKR